MTADELIQLLSVSLEEHPLNAVRDEPDFPCTTNTLHLTVLLIDCDTELSMNGLLGFLQNSTGRFLPQTTEALRLIGCPQWTRAFEKVSDIMREYSVEWPGLQDAMARMPEHAVTTFSALHSGRLDSFADALRQIDFDFTQLFSPDEGVDAYAPLCAFLDERVESFVSEIHQRDPGFRGAANEAAQQRVAADGPGGYAPGDRS